MELGPLAKKILTATAIRLAFNATGRIASTVDLSRMVGRQNIDPKTADRYAKLFASEHGLKYDFAYDDRPGRTNYADLRGDRAQLRGVSGAEAKRRMAAGSGLPESRFSIDDPALRLHELGHVKDLGRRSWMLPAANFASFAGDMVGGIAAEATKKPWLGALISVLGNVPRLVQEWQASRYAKSFLEKHVSKDEADRIVSLLNSSFRTYVYQTLAAAASTATYAALQPKLFPGKPR